MNDSIPPVHTIFLAELVVRQPFLACREVEQVPEEREFFGPRWKREGRAFSESDVDEHSENKRGENGKVVRFEHS